MKEDKYHFFRFVFPVKLTGIFCFVCFVYAAVPSNEEREIARRGHQMFNAHTERVMRQARELQSNEHRTSASGRAGTGGGRGGRRRTSLPSREQASDEYNDPTALHWARREAERFWS